MDPFGLLSGRTSDLLAVLGRLADALEPFESVVKLFAYVTGLVLVACGLLALRREGDGRGLGSAAAGVLCGSSLLCLPSVLDVLSLTLFSQGAGAILATADSVDGGELRQAVRFAVVVIMLVGYVQVVKGLVILRGAPVSGRFWQGVTHVVGGCLCVNVKPLSLALGSTAGGSLGALVTTLLGS